MILRGWPSRLTCILVGDSITNCEQSRIKEKGSTGRFSVIAESNSRRTRNNACADTRIEEVARTRRQRSTAAENSNATIVDLARSRVRFRGCRARRYVSPTRRRTRARTDASITIREDACLDLALRLWDKGRSVLSPERERERERETTTEDSVDVRLLESTKSKRKRSRPPLSLSLSSFRRSRSLSAREESSDERDETKGRSIAAIVATRLPRTLARRGDYRYARTVEVIGACTH